MKKIINNLPILIAIALISNTALYAIREQIDWHHASNKQKIELLKEYTLKELTNLRISGMNPIFEKNLTPSPHGLISLMEGKGTYHQKGIVPFITKIASSNKLLLTALKHCHEASNAIAGVLNLYRTNKNLNLALEKKLMKSVTARVNELATHLAALETDFNALDREKFYLSFDKEAARLFLYFLTDQFKIAIKETTKMWRNKNAEFEKAQQ